MTQRSQRRSASPREGASSRQRGLVLQLPRAVMVGQLAERMNVSSVEVIKQLMRAGIMASINQTIDYDVASSLASFYGFTVEQEVAEAEERLQRRLGQEGDGLELRPPVVTLLGHVDHGKTSLLDYIRKTKVTASEVGGITQRIGAYQAEARGQTITFLDTPGHEAFTALRARGAQVTDIAVLVVAADDGVMPQTAEAIQHIQAAQVPLIVAINKMDLPGADAERVKRQLSERAVLVEDWGGEVIAVPVSAMTGDGIDDLLESILLVAEVEELKASPTRPAVGVIIEARLDANRGPMATVLVKGGSLRPGVVLSMSGVWGRVRAMLDYQGQRIQTAGPSVPVEIMGLSGVPQAGEVIEEVSSEREAKKRVEEYQRSGRGAEASVGILDQLSAQISAGEVPELTVIVRADVQGSVEAVRASLEHLSSERVRITILLAGTGSITESDVFLAAASKALIVGFNTRVEPGGRSQAEAERVEIRTYQIIYRLIEDITQAIAGLAKPITAQVLEGRLEVRQLFTLRRAQVAGCLILDGRVRRGAEVRVLRQGRLIHQSTVSNLRHFKEDVREMAAGQECGLIVHGFDEFEVGDIIEAYRTEEQAG